MSGNLKWTLGKTIQGMGLVVVLAGVLGSISLGMEDEGLASMGFEFKGLMIGGGLFLVGWLLERVSGSGAR
ncbi:MAG: hypothetical protein ACI8QZ_002435 [Chlamydiales bacterium]|jgi:hypothetical protein